MKYYLFKLKFESPVRFGSDSFSFGLTANSMTAYSDTLFSAICSEWQKIYGSDSFNDFIKLAFTDEFLLSDLLPYSNEELFIPKPVLFLKKEEESEQSETNDKKKIKKAEYISVGELEAFVNYLKKGGNFPLKENNFGSNQIETRVAISRDGETLPYYVTAFNFDEDSGLYFLLKIPEGYLDPFKEVLTSLGQIGIGGKKTSGFGKFILREDEYEIGLEDNELIGIYEDDFILGKYLNDNSKGKMLLSLTYPNEDDFNKLTQADTYSLLTRRGFIYSNTYTGEFVKRKNSLAFKQGSVFAGKIQGRILDLSNAGQHPVFRYGKAMMIGGIDNE